MYKKGQNLATMQNVFEALLKGYKVHCSSWPEDEYVYMENGVLFTEEKERLGYLNIDLEDDTYKIVGKAPKVKAKGTIFLSSEGEAVAEKDESAEIRIDFVNFDDGNWYVNHQLVKANRNNEDYV